MKFPKIYNLILIVLFFCMIIVIAVFRIKSENKELDSLREEYPLISFEESLFTSIADINQGDPQIFRNNPHQVYLTLLDGRKRRLVVGYEHNQGLMLDDVLENGDSLIKFSNSFKVTIQKTNLSDSSIFEFDLHDDLGYPMKK